ncbi:tweety -like protein [Brachionus plicatilis]|uniref:Protein tweety homolog n=1 Tax=Brachionus plicatilis TaxID=10195 RepID=A0A3M7QR29_BRAPC|nr:tweety -like protein [Brachionus plicatilis]
MVGLDLSKLIIFQSLNKIDGLTVACLGLRRQMMENNRQKHYLFFSSYCVELNYSLLVNSSNTNAHIHSIDIDYLCMLPGRICQQHKNNKTKPKHKSVALGFLVYGSEQFHYSFKEVHFHVKNFTNYFVQLGSQANQIKELIKNQMSSTLHDYEQEITDLMRKDSKLESKSRSALSEIGKMQHSLNESLNTLKVLSHFNEDKNLYTGLMNQIDMIEQTRWAIMIGVVTINMLLISLLILGLIRNSKGSLCFFAFAGVLSLISIWILNSLYLGITVFFADYCTSPDQYILTVANRNNTKTMVQYFTSCSSGQIRSQNLNKQNLLLHLPFAIEFNKIVAKVRTANTLYKDNFINLYGKIKNNFIYNHNFSETAILIEGLIDRIRASINCDQTSLSYREAVNALCTNSILGLAIVVMSGLVFGFVMPILICVIPQIWRRMHTKELFEYHNSNASGHMLSEEIHPFISSSTATAQIRTNISAARQFNESPNFQRLAANSSSTNANLTNTLNRNRYNTASRSNYAAASTLGSNSNPYSQTLKMTNRLHNDYMLNSDPYSVLNNQTQVNLGLASAPSQSNSNVFQSYYTQTQTTAPGLFH